MKIQQITVEKIKPYWRNARNNDKTIDALIQSIKSYGMNQPLVLDTKHVIITGHARYKACLQLDYKKIPCIILDIPAKKAKEYRIADNKIHEMTIWNNDDLVTELREIGNFEEMQTYFQNIDLTNWLDDSVGFNIKDITEEDVAKKKSILDEKYNAENTLDEQIDLVCPHCYEEFKIKKNDIL